MEQDPQYQPGVFTSLCVHAHTHLYPHTCKLAIIPCTYTHEIKITEGNDFVSMSHWSYFIHFQSWCGGGDLAHSRCLVLTLGIKAERTPTAHQCHFQLGTHTSALDAFLQDLFRCLFYFYLAVTSWRAHVGMVTS